MTTKIIAGVLIVPLFLLGLALTADYAVVDVREGGPAGTRIFVPVPLLLARVAMAFAPAEARYVRVPEIAPYLDDVRRAVDDLRAADDGILVEVEDGDDHVLVQKAGHDLRIDVVGGRREEVRVTVPLASLADVLDAYDGEGFATRDLVKIVGGIHGDLVHVRDGDDQVRIWIW